MAQTNDGQKRIRITFTTSNQVQEYLAALVKTGLYGGTVPEAAEALVCEQIRARQKSTIQEALEGASK